MGAACARSVHDPALMKAKLHKIRGFTATRTCPSCGQDTMRTEGGALRPLMRLMGMHQRWCRWCKRQWLVRGELPPRK